MSKITIAINSYFYFQINLPQMKIHLIAIGGSAMHNMALALYHKGFKVTGSDDAVSSPSKERLKKHGLLPNKMGWFLRVMW